MAEAQVLEGKWEDIKLHDEELIGKEVRVTILPPKTNTTQNGADKKGMSLAEMLKGRTGLVSFEPSDLSEDTGRKFADLLVEKHEKEQR
jgi:hypothetical protein